MDTLTEWLAWLIEAVISLVLMSRKRFCENISGAIDAE